MKDPLHRLADQLAADMAQFGDLLKRRDLYGEYGLDEQIAQLKQVIEVKRAIADGLAGSKEG